MRGLVANRATRERVASHHRDTPAPVPRAYPQATIGVHARPSASSRNPNVSTHAPKRMSCTPRRTRHRSTRGTVTTTVVGPKPFTTYSGPLATYCVLLLTAAL